MKTDNCITARKKLVKACVETAKMLFASEEIIQVFHLWIYDPSYLVILNDVDSLCVELNREFRSHLVHPLMNASIEVHEGKPEDCSVSGVLIADAVAYTYSYKRNDKSLSDNTTNVIVNLNLINTDKNVQESFVLNSLDKKHYNIGRGPVGYDSKNRFRRNDIVINDEHISLAQADLYFKVGKLYLRPASTGYRPNGNPTRVHTAGKKTPIDLCDEYRGYQIQNGDIIELGGRNGVLYEVVFK